MINYPFKNVRTPFSLSLQLRKPRSGEIFGNCLSVCLDHNRFASNINWKARYDQRNILNVEWMNFNLNLPEIPPDLGFPVWIEDDVSQGYNARKVNCSCMYSAYILKPVLSGRNL